MLRVRNRFLTIGGEEVEVEVEVEDAVGVEVASRAKTEYKPLL
jgi:hypothetical protein